jgi:peroxiredoxin
MRCACGLPCPRPTLAQFGEDAGVYEITSLQGELGEPAQWSRKVSSSELLEGKRVLIVGVPGAFTPVCTAKQ